MLRLKCGDIVWGRSTLKAKRISDSESTLDTLQYTRSGDKTNSFMACVCMFCEQFDI